MRVVFLDFDGVLNTPADTEVYFRRYGTSLHPSLLKSDLVSLLNRLTRETGAVIVVSSSWRLPHPFRRVMHAMRRAGVSAPVIDRTPELSERGREVMAWVASQRVPVSYVILDDNPVRGHGRRFVQTDADRGLTAEDVARATALLEETVR